MRDVVYVGGGLSGEHVAALLANVNQGLSPSVRLNVRLLNESDRDRVLSWARREIALGKRVSWLLADELDGLA